mgnify:CR=1 FL=1
MSEIKNYTINMGPQHPSTHGVLRVILELDGEYILRADGQGRGMDLGYPEWVEARSAWGDRELRPFVSVVDYQFPARGAMPPVRLTWYEGLMPRRPEELEEGRRLTGDGNGILFVGEKGKIMCPGWAGNPRMIPEAAMRRYELPPETLPRVGGIYRDWIDACKTGLGRGGGRERQRSDESDRLHGPPPVRDGGAYLPRYIALIVPQLTRPTGVV